MRRQSKLIRIAKKPVLDSFYYVVNSITGMNIAPCDSWRRGYNSPVSLTREKDSPCLLFTFHIKLMRLSQPIKTGKRSEKNISRKDFCMADTAAIIYNDT